MLQLVLAHGKTKKTWSCKFKQDLNILQYKENVTNNSMKQAKDIKETAKAETKANQTKLGKQTSFL